MKKRLAILLACIFLFIGAMPVLATEDTGYQPTGDVVNEDDLTATSTEAGATKTDENAQQDPYQAKSIVLMDAATGHVLYEKKGETRRFPASVTKIMTTICVLDKLDLDDKITISENAVNSLEYDAAIIGISAGDEINVEDALYALMLSSANEIANALAEAASGSVEDFASYMNTKAQQLGCKNTHFVNPSGLHDEEHYTTAYDMALITQAALSYDFFREVASAKSYETMETTFGQTFTLQQHHKMVLKNKEQYEYAYYEYVEGGKTGYTSKAKNTLVTYAKDAQDRELICVILRSPNDKASYSDTIQLFQYGYNEYDWSQVKSQEQIAAEEEAARAAAIEEEAKIAEAEEEKSGFSFFGFLGKLILVAIIIGVCYIGGKAYHEKLERERARLRIHRPRQ
jgi:D-alanyl-D-alanine carboxypeptidase (penicillin-binding protein 5/6)